MSLVDSVKLSDEFLSQYMGKQPRWGFDGLGYIVYLRTYARKKANGTLEDWWETVRRVTEGNFQIEAQRLNELGKLNDERVQMLVTEMERFYHLVFNLVMLPPGRGLWTAGTEYAKKSGDALNNCLRGNERVFVKNVGLMPIGELKGEYEVLSDGGVYRKAVFKSYGVQKLMKITFRDGREVYATPDHQWITFSNHTGGRSKQRTSTKDLKPGVMIPLVRPYVPTTVEQEGIVHGFTYGDGTRIPSGYCRVNYFKHDDELFDLIASYGTKSNTKMPIITNLPYYYKELPRIADHTPEYLLGFLLGYIAADGHVRGTSIRLHCRDNITLDYVREIAQYIGLKVHGIVLERTESPYTGEPAPLYSVSFSAETFPGHLLARREQRDKFKPAKRTATYPYKEVKSVETTDIVEEVFCCNEPETHSFVLEDHILTGNCWFVSMRPQPFKSDEKPSPAFAPCFTFDQACKGGGVGVSIKREHVGKMPKITNAVNVKFVCDPHHPDYVKELKLVGVTTASIRNPTGKYHVVEDSREGWVDALRQMIEAHYGNIENLIVDVSNVRPRGSEIRGFGGTASGPEPLVKMLQQINVILNRRVDDFVTSIEWGDVIQLIGTCVVAGNVRRTALILIGDQDDAEFVQSKNYSLPQNMTASQWRWASNNSVDITPDTSRGTLHMLAENIYYNGEPGYVSVSLARDYGRIIDGYQKNVDGEVEGYNPLANVAVGM